MVLISDQEMIVEKLNTFYVDIAENVGITINATKQNDELKFHVCYFLIFVL